MKNDLLTAVRECAFAAGQIHDKLVLVEGPSELNAVIYSVQLLHEALKEISKGLEEQQPIRVHDPRPSIGRIVHYTDETDSVRPALITCLGSENFVVLCVFYTDGLKFVHGVGKSEAKPGSKLARRSWNWPERT